MRKIIVSNYITLDNYYAGPNGEIDWFVWNKETELYSIELSKSIDTILFGRITYDMMASYWPAAKAPDESPIISEYMNTTAKIVFSKTMKTADWNNTTVINEINRADILTLKQQPGKDIVIYGSGTIFSALMQLELIDDYRFFINPVILGKGKPQFHDINDKIKLKLVETKRFTTGVVLVHYQPEK
jgi:dihydrofolate reductase